MDIHHLNTEEKQKLRKQYILKDFPYSFGISLGEFFCNQRCRMCPMYNIPPKKERFITREVFEQACHVIGERDLSLEISAYGETFQHPLADEFMFTARKKCQNAEIFVATNGTLLDQERCNKIADSGIDILQFSLDAGSKESHKWLTASSHYDQLCRNLEMLIETRERKNAKHLRIFTHIIGIKELAHEFDSFVNFWSPKVDLAHVRNYGNWAGIVDGNGVSPIESQKIPTDRYPCAWLWYATKIEPDGNVSKCFVHVTGDNSPLGNIMETPFEEIWKGTKINRARKLHCSMRHDELEFCDSCIVWSLFPQFWNKNTENKEMIWE